MHLLSLDLLLGVHHVFFCAQTLLGGGVLETTDFLLELDASFLEARDSLPQQTRLALRLVLNALHLKPFEANVDAPQ